MRRPISMLVVLALSLVACSPEEASPTTDTETTVPDATSTTTVPTTATTEAPPTTEESTTTTTSVSELPGGEMVECESPEGYVISHPRAWVTNPGDAVPACGQFNPEEFEVEPTDERVAAITAYIDPVPFAEVAAPDSDRQADRAVTAIDGLQAVRLEYTSTGDGLWPEGTPITLYAIDVSGEEPATMIIDTVGVSSFDYETNQVILDRMARTIDVQLPGVDDDASVVARYGGGGAPFAVVAEEDEGEVCLRIPPNGEPICTDEPSPDQLHTIQLTELQPVLAGVTGEDVFAVTGHRRDGTASTVLPAPIGDTAMGGFSFTRPLSDFESFTLTDITGEELRTITPGG